MYIGMADTKSVWNWLGNQRVQVSDLTKYKMVDVLVLWDALLRRSKTLQYIESIQLFLQLGWRIHFNLLCETLCEN